MAMCSCWSIRVTGTFLPYRSVDQSVELAVVDLTGNGSKDVIYADQSLDRVVVDYGGGKSSILGNQSTGLLAPGAVTLADLNGDGIPDLIVTNSGSNNVLVYLGLGNGQFGPAVNDGHGFYTGTNPIGVTVADLSDDGIPDLLVADSGSNDVTVLIGEGTGSSWTMVQGPRIKTDAGPVAVAVGNILGTGNLDLAVANQEANNVEVFPGVGGGYFNGNNPTTYAVGSAPSGLFLGDFSGKGMQIATLNSGSDTLSVINPSGVIQTVSAGGVRPVAGFAGNFSDSGFTDLVVADNGDGRFVLFTGGENGLSLSQTFTTEEDPNPTSLSFAGFSDGEISFYASTEGRETASLLAFRLDENGAPEPVDALTGEGLAPATEQSASPALAAATAGTFAQVAQLLGKSGSPLDLIATLFTVSVLPGDLEFTSIELAGVDLIANFTPAAVPTASGQSLGQNGDGMSEGATQPPPQAVERDAASDSTDFSPLPLWGRIAIGLDRAWEEVRARLLESERVQPAPAAKEAGSNPRPEDASGADRGPTSRHSQSDRGLFNVQTEIADDVVGRAIDELAGEPALEDEHQPGEKPAKAPALVQISGSRPLIVAVGSAATVLVIIEARQFSRTRHRGIGGFAQPTVRDGKRRRDKVLH